MYSLPAEPMNSTNYLGLLQSEHNDVVRAEKYSASRKILGRKPALSFGMPSTGETDVSYSPSFCKSVWLLPLLLPVLQLALLQANSFKTNRKQRVLCFNVASMFSTKKVRAKSIRL